MDVNTNKVKHVVRTIREKPKTRSFYGAPRIRHSRYYYIRMQLECTSENRVNRKHSNPFLNYFHRIFVPPRFGDDESCPRPLKYLAEIRCD